MRIWFFPTLAAAVLLGLAPQSQSGEIIEETFQMSDGRSVSGWVYQSESTWRYRRSARYSWGGYYGYGFGGYYPYFGTYCSPTFHRVNTCNVGIAPRVIVRTAPIIRPRAATVVRHAGSSPVVVAGNFPKPSPVPIASKTATTSTTPTGTVKPSIPTVRPPKGTTTMRVYRRP